MEYNGKLYGKVGNSIFDTGVTSSDYDNLKKQVEGFKQALTEVYNAGYNGISHVGMANYANREHDAKMSLRKVYDKQVEKLNL